jgi:acetoacetyl-CoA synthetase
MKPPIWTPSDERVKKSQLWHYLQQMSVQTGRSLQSYDDLYDWSVTDIADFWKSIWKLSQIRHSHSYQTVLTGKEIYRAEWFEGARLNFAENLIRYRDNHVALISVLENGQRQQLSYTELYRAVAQCVAGLKKLGVTEGDRVAAFMPNIPEAIMAMLATTSLWAIWSSCSPDFGFQGVLDRFGQIEPKVLITADGYWYNGKHMDSLERVRQVQEKIPAIEQVIVVPLTNTYSSGSLHSSMGWDELLDNDATEIEFAQLPFDHPVYIMYSSGTTGAPKCMVHGAGGTLLQHYKEHALHTDLRREDVITYFTTCGWMMWNWLVSSLQVGATIYLYEGSPSYPNLNRLWHEIEKEGITIFGTSPKFLSSCEKGGIAPSKNVNLTKLRTMLSTGAPLSEGNFEWVYKNVKDDVQLSSISGGTDIISCFMLGNPLLPVHAGEIQCRGLGMKVETYNDAGRPVHNEVGELVCTAPFPSRPVYFLNDPDHKKYKESYFDTFPGVWRHGDFIKITQTGGVIVYGRSDATLNPGGVRIGTADIYEALEAVPEVKDSLVIGQQWDDDVRIVLFVVLEGGLQLDDRLRQRICDVIRTQQTPRHLPKKIVQIKEVPYTLNGKKVEVAVTRILHGKDAANRDALANPLSLEQFRNLKELQIA